MHGSEREREGGGRERDADAGVRKWHMWTKMHHPTYLVGRRRQKQRRKLQGKWNTIEKIKERKMIKVQGRYWMNVITLKTFSLAEATNASLVELVNSESVLRSEEKTKEKEKRKKERK